MLQINKNLKISLISTVVYGDSKLVKFGIKISFKNIKMSKKTVAEILFSVTVSLIIFLRNHLDVLI
ncbi:hypothetical protein FD33_GL000663 [Companilactobacillus paralimentarius DSM 13238 = JCM 10415]|uniref:Uncharacterized protein n=1 Tax=Companilactobacillus paralimentarius DSM 13238 = JCM 10415 TaxID=1122151 RepID=A0A0R1PBB2_9LACO|nr:hypothetical protein ATN96_11340 [Companilactobacillus paralimentarius]KRL29615.1 hypothetical protein FD33_GL000663 [Companilactobacillus paralimentarius DSM 13238 = JCM 10415]